VFHIPALIRHIRILKEETNELGCMNVILLHSNQEQFRPLTWSFSGWREQEYKYYYNVSKSPQSWKSYSLWNSCYPYPEDGHMSGRIMSVITM